MNKYLLILLGASLLFINSSVPVNQVEVIKFDTLQQLMTRDSDKLEVINFWATWCKPCIKELPHFQQIHNEQSEQVNVTLISLDFVDVLESKVIPFVRKRQLTPRVMLLDDIDYNSWIDKVDPSWSGAIPATLVINHRTGKRKFIEGELDQNELEKLITDLSN